MSIVSPNEAARIWAVLKALERYVKEWQGEFKPEILDALASAGIERMRASLPDGEPVAHVTYVAPSSSKMVTDEKAYIEWARETLPGFVVHTPRQVVEARDEVMPQALDLLAVDEAGNVVHEPTGELVPGVAVRPRDPYVTTRFTDEGERLILDALRRGRMDELLMLPDVGTEG